MAEQLGPRLVMRRGSKFNSCPNRQLDLFSVVLSSNPWPRL